jgi:hypothetical protein
VKAANLCNNSNDAAFSRFHRKAVNNSGQLIRMAYTQPYNTLI